MKKPLTEIRMMMPGIKAMIWSDAKRNRRDAERLVKLIEADVSGWKKWSLTWSRVSKKITWVQTGSHGTLNDVRGGAWCRDIRADEFWESVGQIIVWYAKQSERYRNKEREV